MSSPTGTPTAGTRFAIATSSAAVIGGLLAWAVATSWHPVRPRLVCVKPLANGQSEAWFGYSNELEEAVTLPVGDDNRFSPGEPGRGQPEVFLARASVGTVDTRERGFAVAYSGRELRWHLDGREVIASPDAPRCATPPPIPVRDDVAWVKPKPVEPPKPEPPKPEPPKPEPPKPEPPKPEPPKLGTTAPRAKPPKAAEPPPPITPPEPVPLAVADLTNLSSGIVVQGGDETTLGDSAVEVTKTNTKPQPAGDPSGVPDGAGTEPAKVVRTPARVKVRPRGEWPADAPPRAGAVLVKLSLFVDEDGKVSQVKVIKGAGTAFDREARRVGLQAVFSPATEDGKPVAQWVPWVVEFTPDEG